MVMFHIENISNGGNTEIEIPRLITEYIIQCCKGPRRAHHCIKHSVSIYRFTVSSYCKATRSIEHSYC